VRKPPATHAKTLRGFSIFRETVVYHESDLERRVSKVIQLRKDVKQLYSQYPVLLYRDADGVLREHISDYCVVLEDGWTVAVVVKHARKEAEMLDLIGRMKAEGCVRKSKDGKITPWAVDDILLMTEHDATYGAYDRAERIMRARRMRNEAEYTRTLEIVRKLGGQFRFGELLRGCDDRAARRTAVLLLIDDMVLVTEGQGRIDDLTVLMVFQAGSAGSSHHSLIEGIDHVV